MIRSHIHVFDVLIRSHASRENEVDNRAYRDAGNFVTRRFPKRN